jgi:hypothetical protein
MSSLLTAAAFSVALGQSIYTDNDSSTDLNVAIRAGVENVYFVAGWEQPKLKVLGQPVADSDMYTFGLGARKRVDLFSFFLEAGVLWTDEEPQSHIVHEVIYTHLVGNHDVHGRTVPVDPRNYDATYELDDGLFMRVGVGYHFSDNVAVTASYRASQVDTEVTIRDRDWTEGQGYWREDTTTDLGAFEVAIRWEF